VGVLDQDQLYNLCTAIADQYGADSDLTHIANLALLGTQWATVVLELCLNRIGNLNYSGSYEMDDEDVACVAYMMRTNVKFRNEVLGAYRVGGHDTARRMLLERAREDT